MLAGNSDAAAEPPAGGRRNDPEPALPTEEHRPQLYPEDEDCPAGKARVMTKGADGERAAHIDDSVAAFPLLLEVCKTYHAAENWEWQQLNFEKLFVCLFVFLKKGFYALMSCFFRCIDIEVHRKSVM